MEKVSQMSMHASLPQTGLFWCPSDVKWRMYILSLHLTLVLQHNAKWHSLMEAMQAAALTHYNQSWEHVCGGTAAIGIAHFSCAWRKKAIQKGHCFSDAWAFALSEYGLVKLIFISNSGILEFHCFFLYSFEFFWDVWLFLTCCVRTVETKHPKCTSKCLFLLHL